MRLLLLLGLAMASAGATASALGLLNLGAGVVVGYVSARRLRAARVKMNRTLEEFRRDRQWLAAIAESSESTESETKAS